METATVQPQVHDYEPRLDTFRTEVLRGLQRQAKRLPSKFFYDEAGSRLFDQICQLDEYYLTRTELAILRASGLEMANMLGDNCRLVEYGSGSGIKIRILLDHMVEPAAYVPIDIAREHLLRSAAQLATDYPRLAVLPVCADYTAAFDLPPIAAPVGRTGAFFPGSTIGNFEPAEAIAFLREVAATCGRDSGMLIGVDLKKDVSLLHAAYNDRHGITAAFNLNMLARIRRELGAGLQLDQFAHHARYNARLGRIEMRLVSLSDQTVRIGDAIIPFRRGESILTECSYKYTLSEFAHLAERAGFEVRRVWTDQRQWFSIQYLAVRSMGLPVARPHLHRTQERTRRITKVA